MGAPGWWCGLRIRHELRKSILKEGAAGGGGGGGGVGGGLAGIEKHQLTTTSEIVFRSLLVFVSEF